MKISSLFQPLLHLEFVSLRVGSASSIQLDTWERIEDTSYLLKHCFLTQSLEVKSCW